VLNDFDSWHQIFRDGIVGQRGNWQQWWYCSRRHC
jgi:hypothetical protein